MICNPFQAFMPQQQANPFEAWQKLWLQGVQSMQAMQPQTVAPQPVDPFTAMQAMWMQGFAPQAAQPAAQPALSAPKITVTTIELGDMRPYMEMATQAMATWQPLMQPMLNQMLSGGRK